MPRLETRVPANLNFNLEELDKKIKSVDSNLKQVLATNDLDEFVKETEDKNRNLE